VIVNANRIGTIGGKGSTEEDEPLTAEGIFVENKYCDVNTIVMAQIQSNTLGSVTQIQEVESLIGGFRIVLNPFPGGVMKDIRIGFAVLNQEV